MFYLQSSVVNMEVWLSIWPVNLSDTGGLDPDWVQTAVTSRPVAPPPSLSLPGLLLCCWLLHRLCPPCEGGAGELPSTRYCGWYNGLCIWSCYCLGCGEVIQWHFNRLSAFFAMALVLICRIKTQPVRHWSCCLAVEQRGSVLTARTAAHTSPQTGGDVLISNKPRFSVWRHQSVDERMICQHVQLY